MSNRGKRQRTDGSSSSAQHPAPPHPWPRREGKRITPAPVWPDSDKKIATSEACLSRPIVDTWDDYDTLFYNAWLGVDILPTRYPDSVTLRRMGIKDDVLRLLRDMGLGTMVTAEHDCYPDLVRQFLATVRVYYPNEIVKDAHFGILTFFIRGVRYRITLPDLCTIYGFDPSLGRAVLPEKFAEVHTFWSYFGNGVYDSKTSTQADIRHPVLRYVARVIANTILCKMEPGKMRVSELILLYYGLRDIIAPQLDSPLPESDVSRAAIFAHHLVSLKTKPFSGTAKKTERIGSLLTPIFRHLGIPTDESSVITSRSRMDQEHLQSAHWLKNEWQWSYRDSQGAHLIQLPQRTLTKITDDPEQLHFQPPHTEVRRAPSSRRLRGASSTAAASAAEEDVVPDPAGDTPFPSLPTPPTIPANTAAFQRYVIAAFQSVWDVMARTRCRCVRATSPVPPAHAEDPMDGIDADETDED